MISKCGEASLAGLRKRAHLGGEAHASAGKVLRGGLVLLHVLPDVLHAHLQQSMIE